MFNKFQLNKSSAQGQDQRHRPKFQNSTTTGLSATSASSVQFWTFKNIRFPFILYVVLQDVVK